MSNQSISIAIVSGIAVASCAVETDSAEEDEAAALDEPAATTATTRPTPGFQAFAPCATEAAYVSSTLVQFGWGRRPFTPACARLASGGTVVFEGPADQHPIEPLPFGTEFSPIVAAFSGGSNEFEFSNQGFFPFRCARHPSETGVIWSSAGF